MSSWINRGKSEQPEELVQEAAVSTSDGAPPSASAIKTPEDLRKYATIHQGMFLDREQTRKMQEQQEGLTMSSRRRMELCDVWKFYFYSDPIQRGIDFGLVAGGLTAVGSCQWSHNRVPHRFIFFFMTGFSAGMLIFPAMLMYHNASNENKRNLREKTMMLRQREEFAKGGRGM
ncbi:hypothetical protein XU18_4742 [Perkinsela sp. CCAP 1560/4]|nr:hypothetical protein XU18_4742 [Perkinsela sp. CCAP 1560/4]|eukprot:KNH03934.1 hypothetical protein XU18_4742 [Perkinsela sp. CCAP 1560/4]